MRDLREAGIEVAANLDDVSAGRRVLIRAHGIPPQEEQSLRERALEVHDLTCPRVKTIHRSIGEYVGRGYFVFVVGDPQHAETRSHLGYAGEHGQALSTVEDALHVSVPEKALVVAQTTAAPELLEGVLSALRARNVDIEAMNTLCRSVVKRHEWIKRMSASCDASIVLGGKNSSNTTRLWEIARRNGPAYHVEEQRELDLDRIRTCRTVALTSGASTPIETVREVEAALRAAGMLVEPA